MRAHFYLSSPWWQFENESYSVDAEITKHEDNVLEFILSFRFYFNILPLAENQKLLAI